MPSNSAQISMQLTGPRAPTAKASSPLSPGSSATRPCPLIPLRSHLLTGNGTRLPRDHIVKAKRGLKGAPGGMCQVLSWALARSPGERSWAWARLASFCEAGLPAPVGNADVLTGADVAFLRQHYQARGGQLAQDARIWAAVRSWTAPGRPGYPQDLAVRAGDDLQLHPVAAVLAGV
jgi:hypothetical protein